MGFEVGQEAFAVSVVAGGGFEAGAMLAEIVIEQFHEQLAEVLAGHGGQRYGQLAVVAAGDKMQLHGAPAIGQGVAAGGIVLPDDFQLQLRKKLLELGAVMTSAAVLVDDNLQIVVVELLISVIDMAGSG